jgi:uncharacterized protein YigE (DUF2233 family)
MTLAKISLLLLLTLSTAITPKAARDSNMVTYIIDPQMAHLRLYWKDDTGHILRSIKKLRSYVESKNAHLLFAMNGGMYKFDHSPQGLFIQDKVMLAPLDTVSGSGNFYMKPNGVFYLSTDGKGGICKTSSFINNNISYATQSGPMMICNGVINAAFIKGSENLNIRNGVGILPDGKVVFAMSKEKVNFYDFAMHFKSFGCVDALYLDGFVSRTYYPGLGWEQTDGDFGVMIGVTDK